MKKSISDHYYIITGAGSGIGKALAIQAAQQGSKVIIAGIDGVNMAKTGAEIKQNGGWVKSYVVDISRREQKEMFQTYPESVRLLSDYANGYYLLLL